MNTIDKTLVNDLTNSLNNKEDIIDILPITNGGTNANNASTARTQLGLGTVSTYNIGINNGQIPVIKYDVENNTYIDVKSTYTQRLIQYDNDWNNYMVLGSKTPGATYHRLYAQNDIDDINCKWSDYSKQVKMNDRNENLIFNGNAQQSLDCSYIMGTNGSNVVVPYTRASFMRTVFPCGLAETNSAWGFWYYVTLGRNDDINERNKLFLQHLGNGGDNSNQGISVAYADNAGAIASHSSKKTNIEPINLNALDIINKTKLYSFNYKDEIKDKKLNIYIEYMKTILDEKDKDLPKYIDNLDLFYDKYQNVITFEDYNYADIPITTNYGFLADDEINTPQELTNLRRDNQLLGNTINILMKAVQELTTKINILEDKINGENK